ncbi:MAG: hypothetical protein R6U95_10730 [Bacteroidales bacterium]
MKQLVLLFFIVFGILLQTETVYSQSKAYEVYDTIPIRSGTNKYRLYRIALKWLEKEKGTKLVAKNFKLRQLAGKGYFIYYNHVKLEDAYVSPRANERTKGTISFNILVDIQDSIIVSKFFNFKHKAAFSEYGAMSFGRLMKFENVPPGVCMEMEEWCDAVWQDLKDVSRSECKDRAENMIPRVLIRRRSYKEKEDEKEEEKVVEKDSTAHLDIENYIIHDKEEEEETVDTLHEKTEEITKEEKNKTETDEVQEEEEEKSESFFSRLFNRKKESTDYDDEKTETIDEPVVEEEKDAPKEEKKKKKRRKKRKEKEDEYDDYYDDYDDYDDY